jgi:hypothetical protein
MALPQDELDMLHEQMMAKIDLSFEIKKISEYRDEVSKAEQKLLEQIPPHRVKHYTQRIKQFNDLIKQSEDAITTDRAFIIKELQDGSLLGYSLILLLTLPSPVPLSFLREVIRTSKVPTSREEDVNVFIVAHGGVIPEGGVLHFTPGEKERILSYNPPGLFGWQFPSEFYWDSKQLALPLRYKDGSAKKYVKQVYKDFYQFQEYQYFPDCILSGSHGEDDSMFFRETETSPLIEGCDGTGVYIYYKDREEQFEFIPLVTMIQQSGGNKLSLFLTFLKTHLQTYYPRAKKISFLNLGCTSVYDLPGLDMLSIFNVYINFFTSDEKKREQLRLFLRRLFAIRTDDVKPVIFAEPSKRAYASVEYVPSVSSFAKTVEETYLRGAASSASAAAPSLVRAKSLTAVELAEIAANSSPSSSPSTEAVGLSVYFEQLNLFDLAEKRRFLDTILITLDTMRSQSEYHSSKTPKFKDLHQREISNLAQWIDILFAEKNRLLLFSPSAGRMARIDRKKQGSKLKQKRIKRRTNKKNNIFFNSKWMEILLKDR